MKSITLKMYVISIALTIIITALIVEYIKVQQFKQSITYYQKSSITDGNQITNLIELIEQNNVKEFYRLSCLYLRGYEFDVKNGAIEITLNENEKAELKEIQDYIAKYKENGQCSINIKNT